MTAPSAMIKDMKSMPWPVALVVSITILVVGVLAMFDKDVQVVMNAVILLLMALGYAELREVRSQTNGNTNKQNEELAAWRRTMTDFTTRALESQPLSPPPPPPPPTEEK